MNLTRAGWLLAAGAVAVLSAARMLAILELFMIGTAGVVLVASAAVAARRRRRPLTIDRRPNTRRVHVGGSLRVEVVAENRGRRSTPVIELADPVGRRTARLLVAPLAPGNRRRAVYELHASQRGRLHLGPMTATAMDPFGLARSAIRVAGAAEVTVLPHVDVVRPLPRTPAVDTAAGSGASHRVIGAGGDFHSLAPYRPGDDLRRVHWPSSMSRGDLLVRLDEQPWDGVTTVVLDDATAADTDDYEAAISAAASVCAAGVRAHHRTRLLTAGGWDSGFGTGPLHLDRMLRHLALVAPGRGGLGGALALAGRIGGAVAVVSPIRVDAQACRRFLSAAGTVVLVAPGEDVAPGTQFVHRWDGRVLRSHFRQAVR